MGANVIMRLLVVMVVLNVMPKLVAGQTYEALAPSSHPHPPLLLPSHSLSPSTPPSDFPDHPGIRSPPPLDNFKRFKLPKCMADCAFDCYSLHRKKIPAGTFTFCFGNCLKDKCGTPPPLDAFDCTRRCSDSISTNYELGKKHRTYNILYF